MVQGDLPCPSSRLFFNFKQLLVVNSLEPSDLFPLCFTKDNDDNGKIIVI